MAAKSASVLQVGVDWITVSSSRKASTRRLKLAGYRLLEAERRRGNIRKVWGFSGYQGMKCGGVQVGERDDGACVRLSSQTADDHWLEVYHEADGCSRIDLQVTARSATDPRKLISQHYREALKFSRSQQRGPSVNIWKSSNGSATLYLGQRISENFGRIYDKGRESGHEALRGAVRYERECKGAVAHAMAFALSRARHKKALINAEVQQFILARGVSCWWPAENLKTIVLHESPTDCVRLCRWLSVQVSPSVQRLLEAGMRKEVLEALGLETATRSGLRLVRKAS